MDKQAPWYANVKFKLIVPGRTILLERVVDYHF